MRKKQLFALLMAGALSVGMAPTATFAAMLRINISHIIRDNYKQCARKPSLKIPSPSASTK